MVSVKLLRHKRMSSRLIKEARRLALENPPAPWSHVFPNFYRLSEPCDPFELCLVATADIEATSTR